MRKLFPRRSVIVAVILAALSAPACPCNADDFGGDTYPGSPPPGDNGCPDCCNGNQRCTQGPNCATSGQSVNFWDGRERHGAVDFSIPGYMALEFARTYDSQADYDTPLGYGWSHSFDIRAIRFPDGSVTIRESCGARRRFVQSGGAYVSPPGEFRSTLVGSVDGTLSLIDAMGNIYKFDVNGRLATIQDVNGNQLEFQYDPGGRLPLRGTSKYSKTPTTPTTVALDYRLTKVSERDALGAPTGRYFTLAYDSSTGRLQSVTDFTGRTWSYGHDAYGNLTTVTAPLSIISTYSYGDPNDFHNLTSLDEGFQQVTIEYYWTDPNQDKVKRETTATGTVLDIAYSGTSTTVTKTVKDNNGVVLRTGTTTLQFDANGSPTKITDPAQNEWSWARDGQGNVLHEYAKEYRGVSGLVLVRQRDLTYDTAGNMLSETITQSETGDWLKREWTYDHNKPITSRVYSRDDSDKKGGNSTYAYNVNGAPTSPTQSSRIVSGGSTQSPVLYAVTYAAPDPYGQLTFLSYPNGESVAIGYTNGLVTSLDGRTYGRDARGNVTSITDRNQKQWTTQYDALDRPILKQDPTSRQTIPTWIGRLMTQIETGKTSTAAGAIDRFDYDALGRVTRVQRKSQGVWVTRVQVIRDSDGLPIQIIDGESRSALFVYDVLGRLRSVTNGANELTTYNRDLFGNVTKITDAASRTRAYTYRLTDESFEVASFTNGLNETTTVTYDANGNPRTVTDPLSKQWLYSFDSMGRLLSFTDPAQQTTTMSYTARGAPFTRTDAAQRQATFGYNTRGEIASLNLPDPNLVTYEMDNEGRAKRASDSNSDMSFDYDDAGRLILERDNRTLRAVTSGYDGRGVRTSILTSDGTAIIYTYDERDFLQYVTLNGSTRATYAVDNSGLVSRVDYANSTYVTYQRDGVGRVHIEERRTNSGTLLGQITYTRDLGGLVIAKHDIVRRPDGTNSDLNFHFEYDLALRLTAEEVRAADDVTVVKRTTYGYDDAGNRTGQAVQGGDTTTYSLGADYRVTSMTTAGVTTSFDYDSGGNLAAERDANNNVLASYSYDTLNRMIGWNSGGTTTTFELAADGRRLARVQNGARTEYLNDGWRVLAEYPTSGSSRKYLSGPGLDEWLSNDSGTTTQYYLIESASNSVRSIADSTGTVQRSYVYEAFGAVREDTGATAETMSWDGRALEGVGDLLDFRSRAYSPKLGRFLSRDGLRVDGSGWFGASVGGSALEVGELSGRNFAASDPINRIDPLGFWNEDGHDHDENWTYGTAVWAYQQGMSALAAVIVGKADAGLDELDILGTGPWPWSGWDDGRGRHFNWNGPGEPDSRIVWSHEEMGEALVDWYAGNCRDALEHLGMGLHSVQDMIPHGLWHNKWHPFHVHWGHGFEGTGLFLSAPVGPEEIGGSWTFRYDETQDGGRVDDWPLQQEVNPEATEATAMVSKQYIGKFLDRVKTHPGKCGCNP